MYELATIFQMHTCIHILVDMLVELNNLNQKFEEDHVAITYIDTTLHVSISILHK